MDIIEKNRLGMTLGIFVGLWHLLWVILVGIGVAQSYLDWILPLHFVGLAVPLLTFNWMSAILLVIIATIAGYVMGWIFAAIWNCKTKCMKKKRR